MSVAKIFFREMRADETSPTGNKNGHFSFVHTVTIVQLPRKKKVMRLWGSVILPTLYDRILIRGVRGIFANTKEDDQRKDDKKDNGEEIEPVSHG